MSHNMSTKYLSFGYDLDFAADPPVNFFCNVSERATRDWRAKVNTRVSAVGFAVTRSVSLSYALRIN
jgi:hypothetical protein